MWVWSQALGGASTENIVNAIDAMREKGLRGVGAMAVPKTMGSSVSAAFATGLKIEGVSYSLTSACATSTHCIGHAAELIQLGKADVILAGGSESEHWTQSCMFDAMGAVSTQYNETPKLASRAYDKDRDGFVIAAGGAMVVVESLDTHKHAVLIYWPKSLVMAQALMVLKWLRQVVKAPVGCMQ